MKNLITGALLLLAIRGQAQSATIGIGYTSKGFGMDVGYVHKSGVQLTAGYSVSISTTTVPNYSFGNVGYRINVTNSDDWFHTTVTPSIGVSKYTVTVDGKQPIVKTGIKPIYGMEIGRSAEYGSFFISAGYCTVTYFGVGIRAFIK